MSSICRSLTKLNSMVLKCHKSIKPSTNAFASCKTVQRSVTFSRSIWHLSRSASVCNNHTLSGWLASSGIRGMHSNKDDLDITSFLAKEIDMEKKHMKNDGKLPTVEDFKVVSRNGAELVLKRQTSNETVTVKLNVNGSIGDNTEQDPEAEPTMTSRPPFTVEISHLSSDLTLALRCEFPMADEEVSGAEETNQQTDMIDVHEVALLRKGQAWGDDVYTVAGLDMDMDLYEMVLRVLEDNGIDGLFVQEMVELSTAYEHAAYVEFLEQLKSFLSK